MPDNISPTYTWQEMQENIKTITCVHMDKHREFDVFLLEMILCLSFVSWKHA